MPDDAGETTSRVAGVMDRSSGRELLEVGARAEGTARAGGDPDARLRVGELGESRTGRCGESGVDGVRRVEPSRRRGALPALPGWVG